MPITNIKAKYFFLCFNSIHPVLVLSVALQATHWLQMTETQSNLPSAKNRHEQDTAPTSRCEGNDTVKIKLGFMHRDTVLIIGPVNLKTNKQTKPQHCFKNHILTLYLY